MPRKKNSEKLVDCYSDQAEHFGHTREKQRPEFGYIGPAISHYSIHTSTNKDAAKKPTVVELGCGTGRLFGYLKEHIAGNFQYVGTDIAPGMITQAKKLYPRTKFIVDEMNHYLKNLEQESVDIIVAVASIQHLMTDKERLACYQNAYRALRWGGIFLVVNWSYSKRFLHRYWRQQVVALVRSLFFVESKWNDLMIPRKDPNHKKNNKIFSRPYHIYTMYELEQLARLGGFIVHQQGYVQQDGSLSDTNRKEARNTRIWMEKRVAK